MGRQPATYDITLRITTPNFEDLDAVLDGVAQVLEETKVDCTLTGAVVDETVTHTKPEATEG